MVKGSRAAAACVALSLLVGCSGGARPLRPAAAVTETATPPAVAATPAPPAQETKPTVRSGQPKKPAKASADQAKDMRAVAVAPLYRKAVEGRRDSAWTVYAPTRMPRGFVQHDVQNRCTSTSVSATYAKGDAWIGVTEGTGDLGDVEPTGVFEARFGSHKARLLTGLMFDRYRRFDVVVYEAPGGSYSYLVSAVGVPQAQLLAVAASMRPVD